MMNSAHNSETHGNRQVNVARLVSVATILNIKKDIVELSIFTHDPINLANWLVNWFLRMLA
jgi:hypothetical protein